MDSRNGAWQCTRVVVRYCAHSVGPPPALTCGGTRIPAHSSPSRLVRLVGRATRQRAGPETAAGGRSRTRPQAHAMHAVQFLCVAAQLHVYLPRTVHDDDEARMCTHERTA
jgi:hypothetical protein